MTTGAADIGLLGYVATVRWCAEAWRRPVARRLELLRSPLPPPSGAPQYALTLTPEGSFDQNYPYALSLNGEVLIRAADRDTVLDYLIWYVHREATRVDGDHVIIHAGAVVAPGGGAVILPAASGSGKSTLVAGLLARGCRLLSDEYAVIAADGTLTRFPRMLAVKSGSYGVVSGLTGASPPAEGDQWHLRPEDLGSSYADGAHPVVAVVAPRYRAGAEVSVQPLGQTGVVELLARNTVNQGAHADGGVRTLARVARGAEGAVLTYGTLAQATSLVLGRVARTSADPGGDRRGAT